MQGHAKHTNREPREPRFFRAERTANHVKRLKCKPNRAEPNRTADILGIALGGVQHIQQSTTKQQSWVIPPRNTKRRNGTQTRRTTPQSDTTQVLRCHAKPARRLALSRRPASLRCHAKHANVPARQRGALVDLCDTGLASTGSTRRLGQLSDAA